MKNTFPSLSEHCSDKWKKMFNCCLKVCLTLLFINTAKAFSLKKTSEPESLGVSCLALKMFLQLTNCFWKLTLFWQIVGYFQPEVLNSRKLFVKLSLILSIEIMEKRKNKTHLITLTSFGRGRTIPTTLWGRRLV